VGGGSTFLVYSLIRYRTSRKEKLQKQAEDVRNGLSKADAALRNKTTTAAEDVQGHGPRRLSRAA
jgi:hypothetical protein